MVMSGQVNLHLWSLAMLIKYGMENAKSIKTPVNVNSKLLRATDESELVDKSFYQSAVGSLLYTCRQEFAPTYSICCQ